MTSTSTSTRPGKRVLVADDQRDVLTALELLLKAQGIAAVAVTSPEAIVSAVERRTLRRRTDGSELHP